MSKLIVGIKFFFLDLASDIIRWPIWWYTRGLVLFGKWIVASEQSYIQNLAIKVWVKNLFVPMFGRRDWQSRLISVFMRSVQIIGRSFFLFIWTLLMSIVFVLYLVLPILTITFFLYQLLAIITA